MCDMHKINSLNALLSGKSMPWGHLGLCRLLSLPVKAPLDHYYPRKVQQGRKEGRRKGRNTQYPALSQPLTSSTWPWLLSLCPGLPTSSPHTLTLRASPHPPPTLLTGGGQVCTTPSTVWGQESAQCGSSCEAPRGFPGLPTSFLTLWATSAAAGTAAPSGTAVSHARCVLLGWHPVVPPGLEVPHRPVQQF